MSNDKSKSSKEPGKPSGSGSPAAPPGPRLPVVKEKPWVAGVCVSLAERTGLPAMGWRAAFAALSLFYGLGLVLYLVLCLILPDDRSAPKVSLFRRVDWLTFGLTTLLVFVGYYLTLAPDLTLEDSGELAVGSYYAGVPHPPGYPVWTLYTWLFTKIPYSNIAWRVALSSAVAGAFACGLLALLVSRGSSLLLEGLPDLKGIERRWENALCMVAGCVAGMLLGFNGFMWSQAVIVEVYTLSVLSFMAVLCCLFRWIYAPEQRRYLYLTFFWFGICFTNHQTLIVAAMGIEVAILAAHPRLGRDLFIGNSVVYLILLIAKANGVLTTFDQNLPLFMVFNVVGLGSIFAAGAVIMKIGKPMSEWRTVIVMALLWVLGCLLYFYMPIASMTNPPMNWGYPRTVEGFVHALTRGQYDKTNPTDTFGKFVDQVGMYVDGAIDEFGRVYLLMCVVPFLFYGRMQKRERAWLVGLTSIGICLAFLLLILLNPSTDLQSRLQARVFFTSSHIVFAIFIGYSVTLTAGALATQYERFRFPMLLAGAAAVGVELYHLVKTFSETQLPFLRYAAVLGLILAGGFTAAMLLSRVRPLLPLLLVLFSLIPIRSILAHWAKNEQRGHLFGYWFGHDMFTPPFEVYPEMAKNAVLFGGTDPGRFNPTYMIFCESFLPAKYKPLDPKFDRRDVYLITQNALADGTYLSYIRAHYNRSTQPDPYFFSELLRSERERVEFRTNLLARAMLPIDRYFTELGRKIEERRRAEGVYPPKEINTPSPEESQVAFQEYIVDASRRLQHDAQNPNAPRKIKPGEDVTVVDNRVQVSGQVAVMAINGLLTKVIFDENPDHEFYVEESFPLDWMFPHLTPFGIIMKINREKVAELTPEIMARDHEFWSKYSDRLIGNWITYDTPVKEICDFVERTFRRHDFTNFKGDPKFVRDEFAQKAFSKLRSAIGNLYAWRLSYECPPEFKPKTVEEQQRLIKEADFAFRQAFAFCPYSPEAVYKFVNLLLTSGRTDEALLVAETSLKWDASNIALVNLADQLRRIRGSVPPVSQAGPAAPTAPIENQFAELEQQFRAAPSNLVVALDLAESYRDAQRHEAALSILDQVSASPSADIPTLLRVAQSYAMLGNRSRLDVIVEKLRLLTPAIEKEYQADTNNIPLAFRAISVYLLTQKTNEALRLADELTSRTNADPSTLLSAAQVYLQLQLAPQLESTLVRLVSLIPDNPEAWYDLATVQVTIGKASESMTSLRKAVQLSQQRLAVQPTAKDLRAAAAAEPRFQGLRKIPEFQQIVGGK